MTQTLETGKKTTLSKVLNPVDTVMDLATAPTITKGRGYLFNWSQEEWFSYNGIIGNQLQNVVRNLSTTAIPATAGTGLKWIAGTRVKFVAMHDQLVDRGEDINFAWDIAFNGDVAANLTFKPPRFASIAARNAAIPTPEDGMMCVTEWNLEHYNGTTLQWETADTGTPTPNASTTVAGKVETATNAEVTSGTDVGGTGANLHVLPSQLKTTNDNTAAEALKIKSKVDVASATTGNITLSGVQTIDGVAGVAAQRVLVRANTAGAENGVRLQDAWAWTRATDFDANTNSEVDLGAEVWVQWGTVNAGTMWTMVTTGAVTVGTTPIVFECIGGFGNMNYKKTSITSTTARISADTERTTTSTTQVLKKTFRVPFSGVVNVYFEIKATTPYFASYSVYRNWFIIAATSSNTTSTSYTPLNFDIDVWEWDWIDVYLGTQNPAATAYVKNARLRYDISAGNVWVVITD